MAKTSEKKPSAAPAPTFFELDDQFAQAVLHSIGDGLIVIDEYGMITAANDLAHSLLGYQANQLVAKWFPRVVAAVTERGKKIDPIERPIIKSLTTGKAVTESFHYVRQDGSHFPVSVTVSPIVVDGKPIGAVEVFRDISKERELDRAKDDFVSLVSHQLRTPATGIKAILSMIAHKDLGELNPQQQRFINKALESNERQLQLIEELLEIARLDSGRLSLSPVPTKLATLIDDVVSEQLSTLSSRLQTVQIVRSDTDQDVFVDVPKMRIVIENLVSNASKYTHPGGIIEIELAEKPGIFVISVRDNGVGISPEDQRRLFDKFTRIDNDLSEQVGGNGLGLYLVKGLVELHGGRVAVESAVGEGTRFTIVLPKNRGRQLAHNGSHE